MGGGAGIVINGDTMCTLTTIGGDAAGELIGFTSAHCGGPGAQVAAEARRRTAASLGTMVAGNDNLDYAVIKFDPAKVTPVANYNGFVINGIGPDPAFGEIACKQGRTTGNSCGVTWGPGQDPGTIVMQVCGQPGDSGAPVTVNNLLVGMIHGAFSDNLPTCIIKYIPLHTPAVVDVVQRDPGRHQRQAPARRGIRPTTGLSRPDRLLRRLWIASNTPGSSSVDVSPSSRFSATSRSSLRMILPLRVLGNSGTTWTSRGLAIGEISRATSTRSSSTIPSCASSLGAQDDERADGLAGGLVGHPDDRRLGHRDVADQRRLHLGGRDPMPRHVHHVVDAAHHPDRAVGVETGAVAGEVPALLGELGPVGLAGTARGHPRCRAASTATAGPRPGSR